MHLYVSPFIMHRYQISIGGLHWIDATFDVSLRWPNPTALLSESMHYGEAISLSTGMNTVGWCLSVPGLIRKRQLLCDFRAFFHCFISIGAPLFSEAHRECGMSETRIRESTRSIKKDFTFRPYGFKRTFAAAAFAHSRLKG